MLNNRIQLLQQVEPFIGRFFFDEWVKRDLLRMNDDAMELLDKQIKDSLETNVAFASNKGEQQFAQQKPTMDYQAQQQMAAQDPQAQTEQPDQEQEARASAEQEAEMEKTKKSKTKATGEQKDSFDWSN